MAKKKAKTKAVKAKVIKTIVKTKPVQPMAMAMVPYDQISKIETYKGKMSIVPTPLTENQIMQLIKPTPPNVILKRPGKGGKEFNYIPGWWFKKKLNFVFGWMHDFEILGERIDGDFVTVKGKLTIKNAKGQVMIQKTDFGGHPIQYLKGTKNYLDISNDFKAAATDCLKRCATQLGIGLDVYSAGDYTNPQQPDAPADGPVIAQTATPAPVSKAKPIEAHTVQVDYAEQLDAHLVQKAGTTLREKIEYLKKVVGPMAATRFQQLGNKISQQQAQQLLGAVLRGEAEQK